MAKTTFEIGDVVTLGDGYDPSTAPLLVVIETPVGSDKVVVAWFTQGFEYRSAAVPVMALRIFRED